MENLTGQSYNLIASFGSNGVFHQIDYIDEGVIEFAGNQPGYFDEEEEYYDYVDGEEYYGFGEGDYYSDDEYYDEYYDDEYGWTEEMV